MSARVDGCDGRQRIANVEVYLYTYSYLFVVLLDLASRNHLSPIQSKCHQMQTVCVDLRVG